MHVVRGLLFAAQHLVARTFQCVSSCRMDFPVHAGAYLLRCVTDTQTDKKVRATLKDTDRNVRATGSGNFVRVNVCSNDVRCERDPLLRSSGLFQEFLQ